ncbi:YcaO-like family protein [Streptomyces sp. NBC_00237]|uniref:YcaO-like family protein n=1 Tax=Streptomyces sp. NBC_00237 TaxID=2975687 RepID=UPI002258701C|nr:YcaO-like family protein [Streptomyces sp. NBC_00237]MCX5206322.1 YcaO-like family protein [Streptomyces sp. NBC_00237]
MNGQKSYFSGTHRVCPPEQTWERIEPLFPTFGITRIADITWLDDIGIPVYQAIRPDGRYLSVYQGKGLDTVSAKVSAAMEAIERWHGEHLDLRPDLVATAREIAPELGYALDELTLHRRNCLNPGSRLALRTARRLSDGQPSLVPVDSLNIDLRVDRQWQPPTFRGTTNGLASGNTVDEATLHALYEVVERDTLTRLESSPWAVVDPDTVVGHSRALLDHYRDAKVRVLISVLPSPLGIPCFSATIWNDNFPVPRNGFGCHLDSDVALCRALTEAAQVRVSYIAGSRDDLLEREYRDIQRAIANPADAALFEMAGTADAVDFATIPSLTVLDLGQEIDELVTRVVGVTGWSPLVVDHTRDDLGIPVVHVLCPGLAFPA